MAPMFFIIIRHYKWEDCEIDASRYDPGRLPLSPAEISSYNFGRYTLLKSHNLRYYLLYGSRLSAVGIPYLSPITFVTLYCMAHASVQ